MDAQLLADGGFYYGARVGCTSALINVITPVLVATGLFNPAWQRKA